MDVIDPNGVVMLPVFRVIIILSAVLTVFHLRIGSESMLCRAENSYFTKISFSRRYDTIKESSSRFGIFVSARSSAYCIKMLRGGVKIII